MRLRFFEVPVILAFVLGFSFASPTWAAQQRFTDATLERLALARLLFVGPVPDRFGLLFRSTLVLHDRYPIMPEGRSSSAGRAARSPGPERSSPSETPRAPGRGRSS